MLRKLLDRLLGKSKFTAKCDKCQKDLEDLGALAFSPPTKHMWVKKYHICKECWIGFTNWLKEEIK